VLVLALAVLACGGGQPLQVEVTRIVPQTVKVEVTRAVPQTVEVTRIVRMVVTATSSPATSTPKPTRPPAPTVTPTEIFVQPADARASAYIGGNASPPLPAGESGMLAVVATGSYDGVDLPVVVRNNTGEAVIRVTVSAVARSADGKMLAAGGDQGFNPNLVRPGEITLGYVYFGGVDLPPDVTFEFETSARSASKDEFENIRDLDVIDQSFIEDRIVGMLRNPHNERVSGPISVAVVCFDTEGALLGDYNDFTEKDEAEPGDTVPFQVGVRGPCPVFLVAASGFKD
jgi:hypothetical protein